MEFIGGDMEESESPEEAAKQGSAKGRDDFDTAKIFSAKSFLIMLVVNLAVSTIII